MNNNERESGPQKKKRITRRKRPFRRTPGRAVQPPEQKTKLTFETIAERFASIKVMVIGDFISDVYVYGKPFRLSREAPVVVIRHEGESIIPGGAGNAVNNLASLGVQVSAVGILGNDKLGNDIMAQLREKKAAVDRMVLSNIVSTTSKTRIMAGDDHTSKQQVIRIDKINQETIPSRLQEKIYENFKAVAEKVDAVIVSDYGYGVISRRIISDLSDLAKRKVVVVDSRYQVIRFQGVTAVTPNESEAERATRIRIREDADAERAASHLYSKAGLKAVLITRGNHGMTLLENPTTVHHIPICGSDDVTDVTGAGDTVVATFTAALAAGAGFYDAALLANCAAGVVVMKSGTAVVTRRELIDAVRKHYGKKQDLS